MPDIRSLVSAVCREAGLDPDRDIDVSRIDGRVEGMVVAHRTTARTLVEAVQRAFLLDVVERDGRLAFVPRGGDPVASLAEDELVPFEDGRLLVVTRRQEAELPRQVDVVYASPAADFQTSTQSARRAACRSREVVTAELPLALSDDGARRVADALLADAWAGRDAFSFQVTTGHAALEPGDAVELAAGGMIHRLRILRTEMSTTLLRIEAVADEPSLASSTAVGAAAAPRLAGLQGLAPTVLFALDLPLLRDEDEGSGYYVAASYDATVAGLRWPGAVLLESSDGGASFARIRDLGGPASWGVCLDALGDAAAFVWDEASVLTVEMRNGTLESRDARAVLNGANAAVVGGEIVQFRDARLVATNTYRLSGFLRGRRGTEHRTGGHAAGETFLLLTPYDLARVRTARAAIGARRLLKAVTLGMDEADQPAHAFTNTGACLKPFAPGRLRGQRDAASGDWSVRWMRRTRIGGAWIDGADVPLGEESERYEVEVLDGAGAVVRTIAATTPSCVYPVADQIADFGTPQSALRVRVYQISAAIGRGHASEAML